MQAATLRSFGYLALATAVGILLAIGILSFQEWRRYDILTAQRDFSRRVLTFNRDLTDLVRDAETGQRGFLLTGRTEYLESYNQALEKLPAAMTQLQAIVTAGAAEANRFRQLRALTDEKLTELRDTIDLFRSQGRDAALIVVQTDRGKHTMDRLVRISQEIDQAENARWREAWTNIRIQARNLRIIVLLGTAVLVALLAGGGLAVRNATRQMEAGRDLLRATLYSIGDGVIATDCDGNVQMMNSVAEQLTGFTEAEARGRNIEEVFKIVNESSRAAVENPVRHVIRDGKTVGLANHTILISKSGKQVPIDDSGAPVARAGEKASGVVLVFRDVSERKRAAETARRLASIVENSDDAIIGKTLDGIVTTWNRGAEHLFGYTAEEMVGQPISRIVPPDRAEDMTKILGQVAKGESVDHYETQRVTKDGRRITVALTISPIRNNNGDVIGASKIARDVTRDRELEQSLRQTQKMEAVGRLAGGVAHDFNNLLTVIMGYATTLSTRIGPDDPAAKMTTEIQRAAAQAAAVTGQLLAFSRKQVTQLRVLNLNDVLLEMKDMLQRLLGEDVDLNVVLEKLPCLVMADHTQLSQVLLNLAVNARDAMPLGGKLTIETHKVSREREDRGRQGVRPAGVYAELVVTDTGEGMDTETLTHIFEPFFTTKESGKGTGLGLATVYGIVQQHKGWVDVYSEPQHGTTFRAYFPIAEAATVESPVSEKEPAALAPSQPATILLVEDQAAIRMLAEDVLADAGHTILSAANGRAALELATKYKGRIDVLVTDVVMPEMSGPELAGKLIHARPELLVLYMSGFTDHALLHQGAIEQGTAFLQKPFVPEALLAKVDSLWRKDMSARA